PSPFFRRAREPVVDLRISQASAGIIASIRESTGSGGTMRARSIILLFAAGVALAQAQSGFAFFHEFYGSLGYTDPEAARQLARGSANGLTFSPPVVSGVAQFAQSFGAQLMLRLPDAAAPAGLSNDQIEKQRADFD